MDDSEMPPLEEEISSNNRSQAESHSLASSNVSHNSDSSSNDDGEDESEDYENGWLEQDGEEDEIIETLCFFCDDLYSSPSSMFDHLETGHKFNIFTAVKNWSLDQISFIKFINYVRQNKPSPEYLLGSKPQLWQHDTYMKPVMIEDPMLTFDIDDFYDMGPDNEEIMSAGEDRRVENVATLKATCDQLREVVSRQRETMQRMMIEAHGGRELKVVKTVSDIDADEDEGYFNSYAYFDIHHEMLSDKVRTEAYRDAILKNSNLFSGKNVLDVGCGTAILSMFAAQAGGKVTAVDMSDVLFQAIEIVKENKLDDVITLKKGRLEDMNFTHKFDVIVSEWMGYFLLFEGMLDSVIYARRHYLSPNGVLLPNRCTLHLVGVEDNDSYEKFINFWNDVYGFKMTFMVREVIKEASTEIVKKECICTTPAQLADYDLMTVSPRDTEFSKEFSLTAQRDGNLTAFVGYFDTYFNLPNPVFFSTGPHEAPTHWKQTIFYLPSKRPIKKDEVIDGKIYVRRKKKEIRSLDVVIAFDDKKYHYFVE